MTSCARSKRVHGAPGGLAVKGRRITQNSYPTSNRAFVSPYVYPEPLEAAAAAKQKAGVGGYAITHVQPFVSAASRMALTDRPR